MLLINFFKKASGIIFCLFGRLLMLFFRWNTSKIIAFFFLLNTFSLFGITGNSFDDYDQFESRILEANHEVVRNNSRIKVYGVTSGIFFCSLLVYFRLRELKLRKQLEEKNQLLTINLYTSKTRNELLEQKNTAVLQFYGVLKKRVNHILGSLMRIKSELTENQEKLEIELDKITDFTETVSSNLNRSVKLFK